MQVSKNNVDVNFLGSPDEEPNFFQTILFKKIANVQRGIKKEH